MDYLKGYGLPLLVPALPGSSRFRDWVAASLKALGMKPRQLATLTDSAPNGVRRFLSGAQVDVRLATAGLWYEAILKEAAAQSVELPELVQVVVPNGEQITKS